MASVGRSRAGSGGKVLRPRRLARVATPYDRPPNPRPANPSWISKLVLSPTRVIASGAGKFLSSVFTTESASSSSGSDSDSDSDSDADSDGGVDEDNINMKRSSAGADELDEERGKSEAARTLTEEPKNENKLLIEQLLMQELFSREECERLTNIIKSRVVEDPDVEMLDLNTALLEAKKWVKEKKSGSNPELDLIPCISSHVNEGQTGSPVDVAKSFMKDRAPWISPYSKGEKERAASPMGIRLFKDDLPLSSGGNSPSSAKSQLKRDGPIIGSWNITDEIRRVRSKATEQMLTTPSANIDSSRFKLSSSAPKLDWSRPVLEFKYSLNSLVTNDSEDGLGQETQPSTKLYDAFPELPAEVTANWPTSNIGNRLDNEVPTNPSLVMSKEDQGLGDGSGNMKTIVSGDEITHKDSNGSIQQHEGSLTGDASSPNGLQHLTSGSNAVERDFTPYDEEQNPPTSGLPCHSESHEPLKEASLEGQLLNEKDDFMIGSQSSSSKHDEDMQQDTSPQVKQKAAAPRRGRKITRYGRNVK